VETVSSADTEPRAFVASDGFERWAVVLFAAACMVWIAASMVWCASMR
jgi:hypothetical protein